MNRKRSFNRMTFLNLVAVFGMTFGFVSSQPLAIADSLDKMRARVGQIVEMKEKGIIGEQQDGLLGVIKDLTKEQKATVAEENEDRETLYTDRSKKQGSPLETLRHVLASKRIDQEPAGRMIPDKDGKWVKKK